jgi:hypothetical protein
MRKQIADNPSNHGYTRDTKKINPSYFAWAVYDNIESKTPILKSENWIDR